MSGYGRYESHGLPQMPRHLRAWRKPRRDMKRPQAPVPGYELGWRGRWDDMDRLREMAVANDLNAAFKAMYRPRRVDAEMGTRFTRLMGLFSGTGA